MIAGKRGTKELFIEDSKKIFGDIYDYSNVVYVNNHTKVEIICPKHGSYCITPMAHLQGQGCKYCLRDKRRELIFGVGVNDLYECSHNVAFSKWYNMIRRCYDPKYHKNKPTYTNAEICDEWKRFSNFKEWFDKNYIDGYHLDKDLLIKGNKIYAPNRCCFVPSEINSMLTKSDGQRADLPLGVKLSKNKKKYEARLTINKGYIHLGTYDTIDEAFFAYKKAKEKRLKDAAKEYFEKKLITEQVYNALMRYEVFIDD